MARPALNSPRSSFKALAKLPPPPRGMTREQSAIYRRYGKLLLDAGMLAGTDIPMIESAARVLATLDDLYSADDASPATIAALERLHKEQLVQLGLTPAARRAVQPLGSARDSEGDRLRSLLE